MPKNLRDQLSKDPFMEKCVHEDNPSSCSCSGPMTFEHAWTYAGRQIQEAWAIVPCCRGHNVGVYGAQKRYNQYRALLRATPSDLAKYPKVNWAQELIRLDTEFGENRE